MVIVKACLENNPSIAIVILCAMHLVTVVMIYILLNVLIQIVSIEAKYLMCTQYLRMFLCKIVSTYALSLSPGDTSMAAKFSQWLCIDHSLLQLYRYFKDSIYNTSPEAYVYIHAHQVC